MIKGTSALQETEQIKCPYISKEEAVGMMGYMEYIQHTQKIAKWEREHGNPTEAAPLKVVKEEKKIAQSNKITPNAASKAVEHIEFIHGNDDGMITLLRKPNKYSRAAGSLVSAGKAKQYHYRKKELAAVEFLTNTVAKTDDAYASVNSFYCSKRSAETIRRINALYVDVDKHDVVKVTTEEIKDLLNYYKENIWGKSLPEPSSIVASGRGIQIYWRIEDLPYQGLPLWVKVEQAVAKTMNKFNHNGFTVDFSCTDVTRVLRMVGTQNSKSRTQAREVYHKENRYRLDSLTKDYFQSLYISPSRRKALEEGTAVVKTEKQKQEFKLFKILNTHTLHMARLNDIVKLQELRNAAGKDCKGMREFMCFLYRYYSCFAVLDTDLALENTLDFNRNFLDPIPEERVINQTISAEKAYSDWQEQYSLILKNQADGISTKNHTRKGYNYKTETLVKMLKITKKESRELQTLIRAEVKQERNTAAKRSARRNSEGLTSREQSKIEVFEEVKKLYEQGLKQVQIVEKTGLSKGRVSQIVKQIKGC